MPNIACICGAFPYGGIHAVQCPMSPLYRSTEDINPDALDSHIGTGMAGAVGGPLPGDEDPFPFGATRKTEGG